MTRSLLIVGRGGHGRVVADVARDCGYDALAFLDDSSQPVTGPEPTLGPLSMIETLSADWPTAFAAIGNNKFRQEVHDRLRRAGYLTPALVHPSAVVSRNAQLGNGVFVAPGAIVNTGARIGDAAIINTGARIDHDCDIGAGSHIAPGATLSGNVSTGERAWLGTGCSVKQGMRIGDDVTAGVGAAIISDLTAGLTYVGVPAQPLAKSS